MRQVVPPKVSQPEIQKQIPLLKPEIHRRLVFAYFISLASSHAIRKAQVIMRQRVVGVEAQELTMQYHGIWVIFLPKGRIRRNIAYFLIRGARPAHNDG